MELRFRINKNIATLILMLVSLAVITGVFVNIKEDLELSKITGLMWTLTILMVVLIQIHSIRASQKIKEIIALGYFARLGISVFQEYGSGSLHVFISNSDQRQFLGQAYELFHSSFGIDYSADTYQHMAIFISELFHVMGADQLAARSVNIYAWFLGCLIICGVAGYLKGKKHFWLITMYALLPWDLMLSTHLLREPIKQLFLMLSLYFLLRWMENGRFREIIISVVMTIPALWMHTGDVAMWGVIFLVYVFWVPKTQRWRKLNVSWKHLLLIAAILALPIMYDAFVTVFPGKFSGTFSISYFLKMISVYTEGRTTYVPNVTITTIPKFLFWTVYRMFYFWVSPTPRYWSSVGDIIAFALDTIPWMMLFMYMIKMYKRGMLSEKTKIAIPIFLVFTFIYAWGTLNGGTAMRHRGHLLGMFIMLAMMEKKVCLTGRGKLEDIDTYKSSNGIV